MSALLGLHLSVWHNCSIVGAMVLVGAMLFGLAWWFSPSQGLIRRWLHRPVANPHETALPDPGTESVSP